MTPSLVGRWLRDFAFTQIVEVPIYRRAFGCGYVEAFGASALTHPIVWWLNALHVWHAPWWQRAVVSELFAWLAEAAYFRFGFGRRRALLWTLVANGASFGLALVAFWVLGVR